MRAVIALCLLSLNFAADAAGRKDCAELQAEIAQKLDAKGVQNYLLTIVPKDEVSDQKIIGSCDGGTHRIAYRRELPMADVNETAVATADVPQL